MKWQRTESGGYASGEWRIEPWDELVGRGVWKKRWHLLRGDKIVLHGEAHLRDCKEWASDMEADAAA